MLRRQDQREQRIYAGDSGLFPYPPVPDDCIAVHEEPPAERAGLLRSMIRNCLSKLEEQLAGSGSNDARQPSNKTPVIPQSFAPRSILQSLEMHGDEDFMHGYRSGNRIGVYNGLRVTNIEAEMEEGVATTVTT
ncbi:hypothetical protein N7530_005820 [Penicillium desertorum]|uniref:Uncharacterized protein n=1 Tax=Penicillium desertorum TaxID=1303715 RepID=A0A9W9X0V0_9EURO|nr:hypothetical protein N7530_005820 [Penicillium desertorum]